MFVLIKNQQDFLLGIKSLAEDRTTPKGDYRCGTVRELNPTSTEKLVKL